MDIEQIEVGIETIPICTLIHEPDMGWADTCPCRTVFRWADNGVLVGAYKTIEDYWCDGCQDEHEHTAYRCQQCNELMEPEWYVREDNQVVAGLKTVHITLLGRSDEVPKIIFGNDPIDLSTLCPQLVGKAVVKSLRPSSGFGHDNILLELVGVGEVRMIPDQEGTAKRP